MSPIFHGMNFFIDRVRVIAERGHTLVESFGGASQPLTEASVDGACLYAVEAALFADL